MNITKKQLKELYIKQNLSAKETAKILKCCRTTIYNYLKKYNLPSKKIGGQKKYFANDNFFSEWSWEMAYCLGFIAGDGHIWKDRPFLTIGIHKKDKEILKFIRDCISPTSKVREGNDTVQICVHSEQIWKDLQKYNINHNKTFNLNINFKIPNEFLGDYLRGFFDADGCIYNSKPNAKTSYYNSTFACASKEMVDNIKSKLGFGKIRIIRGKYYELSFNEKETLKLFNIIYYDRNHFKLERKYRKFLKIRHNVHIWSKKEEDIIIKYHNNDNKLKQLLPNRTKDAIRCRRIKLGYSKYKK